MSEKTKLPSTFVPRTGWGARICRSEVPRLALPVEYVIVTYRTDSLACMTSEQCVNSMVKLQKVHQLWRDLPDVAYNFVVGGDGKIYEGRGWEKCPEKSPDYPDLLGKSVEFAFLGNYFAKDIQKRVIRSMFDFVRYFTYQKEYVRPDYILKESEPLILPSTSEECD